MGTETATARGGLLAKPLVLLGIAQLNLMAAAFRIGMAETPARVGMGWLALAIGLGCAVQAIRSWRAPS